MIALLLLALSEHVARAEGLVQDADLAKIEDLLLASPSPRLEADYEIDADTRGTLSLRWTAGDKIAIRATRNGEEVLALVSDGARVSLRHPEQKAVVSDVLPGLARRALQTFVRRGFRGAKPLGVELARVAKAVKDVPRWEIDGVRPEPGKVTLGFPEWTLYYDATTHRLLKTVTSDGAPPINRSRPRPVTTTYKVWEPDAKHPDDTFTLPKD